MYCRYSTYLQKDTSIDDQIFANTEFAFQRSLIILKEHIYIDRCTSGAKNERKGLDALLKAAKGKNPDFDYILIYDTSRFFRTPTGTLVEASELRFIGVNIFFVRQGIDTADKNSLMQLAFYGIMDYQHNEKVAADTHRGIKGQIQRGYHGGSKHFGYQSVAVFDNPDKIGRPKGFTLLKIEKEVETVALIFKLFGENEYSLSAIKRHLYKGNIDNKSYIPPKGNCWYVRTINNILRSPIYKGTYIWNKRTKQKNPVTGEERFVINPRSEWVIMQKEELRIVSDELWDKVQVRLDAINFKSKKRTRKSLFSRQLFTPFAKCGVCNRTFPIVSGGLYPVYGCSGHRNAGALICPNPLKIKKNIFEKFVIDALCVELLNPDLLSVIFAEIQRALHSLIFDISNQDLKTQLATAEDEIRNIIGVLKKGEDKGLKSETLLTELSALEMKKKEIENQLNRAKLDNGFNVSGILKIEDLKRYFNVIAAGLGNGDQVKSILPEIIDNIIVYPKDDEFAEVEVIENNEKIGQYILELASQRFSSIRFPSCPGWRPYTSRTFRITIPIVHKRKFRHLAVSAPEVNDIISDPEVANFIRKIRQKELTPLDECLSIAELVQKGHRPIKIAKLLRKSKSYVSTCLRIARFIIANNNRAEVEKLIACKHRIFNSDLTRIAYQPSDEKSFEVLNSIRSKLHIS